MIADYRSDLHFPIAQGNVAAITDFGGQILRKLPYPPSFIAKREPIYRVSGAESPVGFRGRAPGQEAGGEATLKLKAF